MRSSMKQALLATSLLVLPGVAVAQTTSDSQAPCDRLIQVLQQHDAQELSINFEQARQYRENDNTRACQTALRELEEEVNGSKTAAANGDRESAGKEGSQITVEGGAPQIRVQQSATDVRVEQQRPSVTVDRGQPEIVIHQPAPTINIQIPRPQVTLILPEPDVSVSTPSPQVSVDQAEPQIEVVRPPQAQAQASVQMPEPIVRYESEKPQIDVTQTGEVDVRMELTEQGMAAKRPDSEMRSQAADIGMQFSVADLKGMDLMDAEGQRTIGTVSAVITDSEDRTFVIVDRDDGQVAILVTLTGTQDDHLVLQDGVDESRLPDWSQTSDTTQELDDNQQVRVQSQAKLSAISR